MEPYLVAMAMDSVCGWICAWEMGWEGGVGVREREGVQILTRKWIAMSLRGLTVWSPVAVVGTILSVTDSYMIV